MIFVLILFFLFILICIRQLYRIYKREQRKDSAYSRHADTQVDLDIQEIDDETDDILSQIRDIDKD